MTPQSNVIVGRDAGSTSFDDGMRRSPPLTPRPEGP
jgi:hypothetical protein